MNRGEPRKSRSFVSRLLLRIAQRLDGYTGPDTVNIFSNQHVNIPTTSHASRDVSDSVETIRTNILMNNKKIKQNESTIRDIDAKIKLIHSSERKNNNSKTRTTALSPQIKILLTRRKNLEAACHKLHMASVGLESQLNTLDQMDATLQLKRATEITATTMKSRASEMNIEEVDGALDDIEEATDLHSELSQTLNSGLEKLSQSNDSNAYDGSSLDDDTLKAELDKILGVDNEEPEMRSVTRKKNKKEGNVISSPINTVVEEGKVIIVDDENEGELIETENTLKKSVNVPAKSNGNGNVGNIIHNNQNNNNNAVKLGELFD